MFLAVHAGEVRTWYLSDATSKTVQVQPPAGFFYLHHSQSRGSLLRVGNLKKHIKRMNIRSSSTVASPWGVGGGQAGQLTPPPPQLPIGRSARSMQIRGDFYVWEK